MPRTIDAILFDLDLTLYHPSTGLLEAGDRLLTEYLAEKLSLPWGEADALRLRLWRQYGTTARGAEVEFALAQAEVYAHSIARLDPGEYLCRDEPLRNTLCQLPLPLYVITNAIASYARAVLAALGVEDLFKQVFDIAAMGWRPKPEPEAYRRVLAALQLDGPEVVMVEDFVENLRPAMEMGMLTVLVGAQDDTVDLCLPHVTDLPVALRQRGLL